MVFHTPVIHSVGHERHMPGQRSFFLSRDLLPLVHQTLLADKEEILFLE